MMLAAVKITFLAGLALTGFDSVPTADGEPRIAAAVDVQNITPAPGPLIQEAAFPTEPNPPSASPTLVSVAAPSAPLPERADDVSPARTDIVAEASVGADDLQAALSQASSRSALSVHHVFGTSVARAADLPPVPEVAAPAPNVRPMTSPVAPERVVRPDEITPQAPPAPTVGPFVSPDSAARKQAELNLREQELLALQQQMENRMNELHGLENRLQGMLQDANTAQESKFKQLVDMYANMKPRQAAQALTNMDESIAVKILTGMKSKQSGEILSYMEPTHAARLSEVMSKMQM